MPPVQSRVRSEVRAQRWWDYLSPPALSRRASRSSAARAHDEVSSDSPSAAPSISARSAVVRRIFSVLERTSSTGFAGRPVGLAGGFFDLTFFFDFGTGGPFNAVAQ